MTALTFLITVVLPIVGLLIAGAGLVIATKQLRRTPKVKHVPELEPGPYVPTSLMFIGVPMHAVDDLPGHGR